MYLLNFRITCLEIVAKLPERMRINFGHKFEELSIHPAQFVICQRRVGAEKMGLLSPNTAAVACYTGCFRRNSKYFRRW
jgi:hypothetical protein